MILVCPNCSANVSVSEGMRGQQVRCTACGKPLTVPEKDSETAPEGLPPLVPVAPPVAAAEATSGGTAPASTPPIAPTPTPLPTPLPTPAPPPPPVQTPPPVVPLPTPGFVPAAPSSGPAVSVGPTTGPSGVPATPAGAAFGTAPPPTAPTAPPSPTATPPVPAFAHTPSVPPPTPTPTPPLAAHPTDGTVAPWDVQRGSAARPLLGEKDVERPMLGTADMTAQSRAKAKQEAGAGQKLPTLGPGEETWAEHGRGVAKGAGQGAMDFAGAAAKPTGEALAGLPILGQLTSTFAPLVASLGKAGQAIGGLFGGKGSIPKKEDGVAPKAGKEEKGGSKEGAKGGGMAAAAAVAESLPSMGTALGTAFGALAGITSGLVQTFSSLVSVAGQYVQAINPSLTAMLAYTFRDLQAVIGSALIPVIQTAVSATRFLADALVEPMRALRPVVAALSATFGGIANALSSLLGQTLTALTPSLAALAKMFDGMGSALQGVVSMVAGAFSLLEPVVNVVAGLFGALMVPCQGLATMFAEVMRAAAAVAAGIGAVLGDLVNLIGSLFGSTGDWLMKFGEAIQGVVMWLIKMALVAAAMVANFVGATSFVKGMIKSLEGPKKGASTGMQAGDVSIGSLESFSKDLMTKSLMAQPIGPEEKKIDPMAEVIASLKDLKDGSGSIITDAIVAAVPELASAMMGSVGKAATSAAEYVGSTTRWGWDVAAEVGRSASEALGMGATRQG